MNHFEVMITHYNGTNGKEFLSSLALSLTSISERIEYKKKFSLRGWDVVDSDEITSEVHSGIEEAISHVDNDEGKAQDVFVVCIFNNGDLMNKFLYHAFPGIEDWLHVKLPDDLI